MSAAPGSDGTIGKDHILFVPCSEIFRNDFFERLGTVAYIIVSDGDQGELVADYEDDIGFAADSNPIVTFHLGNDSVLEGFVRISELLDCGPACRIPIKDDGFWLIEFIVVEKH